MGKRGNGEGSITRRKDGLYMARYCVQTATDSKRKYIYGKTRKEAAEKLAEALASRDKGLIFDAGALTISAYLDRWLNDSVRGTVRQRTWERYEQIVRVHLRPAFGRMKLKNLTTTHARALYREKLDAGLAPRTVNYIHTTLSKALKDAVADGLIPRNVTEGVKAPRPRKKEINPLTAEQARCLLEAARGNRFEALYAVALTAGLREGELLGLKWEDIDLEGGKLSVRRTLSVTKKYGHIFEPPKNDKGRSVKLSARGIGALKRHKAAQNAERLRASTLWQDNNLVFPSQRGTTMSAKNLTARSFKPLLERAGLTRSVRLHDLRHTCATILLKAGQHPKFVQELLGHANISITLDTYSHVLPGMGDGLADAMDSMLG